MFTATPLATVIAGRPVSEYVDAWSRPRHDHGSDTTVGYVVRRTIDPLGIILWHDSATKARCGVDVLAVEGATRYADTFAMRDELRQGTGYAVVDTLYACGCRTGLK